MFYFFLIHFELPILKGSDPTESTWTQVYISTDIPIGKTKRPLVFAIA